MARNGDICSKNKIYQQFNNKRYGYDTFYIGEPDNGDFDVTIKHNNGKSSSRAASIVMWWAKESGSSAHHSGFNDISHELIGESCIAVL